MLTSACTRPCVNTIAGRLVFLRPFGPTRNKLPPSPSNVRCVPSADTTSVVFPLTLNMRVLNTFVCEKLRESTCGRGRGRGRGRGGAAISVFGLCRRSGFTASRTKIEPGKSQNSRRGGRRPRGEAPSSWGPSRHPDGFTRATGPTSPPRSGSTPGLPPASSWKQRRLRDVREITVQQRRRCGNYGWPAATLPLDGVVAVRAQAACCR